MSLAAHSRDLNPEQLAASTAPDGPILVLAAAGTGKTRTLVHRVAWLVDRGIAPDRVLLLTFTNKAAREMLDRAAALIGAAVGGVWGGTFHHLANRVLRRHGHRVGFQSDYTILDREDARGVMAELVRERTRRDREFPKPDVLLAWIGTAVNSGIELGAYLASRVPELAPMSPDILRVAAEYAERKQRLGAMDFDDLLVFAVRLFETCPDVLAGYQQRFLHVLVDEYQDTNPLQATMVDRLAAQHGNLMVVGDDFQSIYGWRGADLRNLMTFPERYPRCATYRLETNYRSVPAILEVANACMAGAADQFQKTLRPTRKGGAKPFLVRPRDGDEQAYYAVQQIRRLHRAGYRYDDMAILYRAHFHSLELQVALDHERIPYVLTSGIRFFEQAHIKDVCSVLRLLAFPADELAFARLVQLLPGAGPKTAQKAWAKMNGRFVASDPICREAILSVLRPPAAKAWKDIEPILSMDKTEALAHGGADAVARFVSAFYDHYARLTYENADRRLEDLQALTEYAARHESAEEFLNEVALLTNVDAEPETDEEIASDAIRLSTVHQAKGLEWRAVILAWVTDGMFPSSRSINESPDGEAEERRLFYVAVTRAKDELHLCMPEVRRPRDGGVLFCAPSRFVRDIPPDLFKSVGSMTYYD
jgi:DNA helicase-2/ATP-dependent DNA helicase PcrA